MRILGLLSFVLSTTLLAVAPGSAQNAATPLREISVSAQAEAFIEPDTLRITFLIEETGKTAQEAHEKIETKAESIQAALLKVDPKASIGIRGEHLGGASAKRAPISRSTATKAQRFLAVESSSLNLASALIDSALTAGATSTNAVEYSVREVSDVHLQAVKLATSRGKQKAELLAKSLGVKLGKLLSASVTEEPTGVIFRQNMQNGKDVRNYSEKELRILASLRFAVE